MAFPATLNASGYLWSLSRNSRHGPFVHGSNLYCVLINDSSNLIQAYKSTDAGDTWATFGPTLGHHATAVAAGTVGANMSGDILLVSYWPTSGNTLWASMDVTAGSPAWTPPSVTNGVVTNLANLHPSGTNPWQVYRRSDGTTVLLHWSTAAVMGNDYGRVRCAVWASGGGSRTIYEVSNGNTTLDTALQTHFVLRTAIQAGDRIHIFYTEHTSGAFTGLRHRTLESDNSWGTLTTIDSTPAGAAADTTAYTCGLGCTWDDSGTTRIVQPYVDSNGALTVARCATGSNPTFTFQAVSGTSTNDPEFTTANPGAAFADGTTVHLLWPDDTTGDIYHSKSAAGGAWDTPDEWKDAVACAGINVTMLTGKAGVLYDDGGTVKYDEYSLTLNQTLNATVATATLTAQTATVTAGSVTLPASVGSATLTAQNAVLSPGSVTLPAAVATAALAAQTATLTPGTATVSAGAAQITATAQTATVTSGSVTVPASVAAATLTAQTAALAASITLPASAVEVAAAAQTATVTPGSVTVPASPATVTATSQTATLTPGSVTLEATPATLTLTAQTATIDAGGGTQNLDASPATAAITAQTAALAAGSVTLPASAVAAMLAAQTATVTAGSVTIPASPATATLSAQTAGIAIEGGPQEITASPALATLSAQTAVITAGSITLSAGPATAALSALSPAVTAPVTVAVTPATATLAVQPAVVTASVTVAASPALAVLSAQTALMSVAGSAQLLDAGPVTITLTAQTAGIAGWVRRSGESVIVRIGSSTPVVRIGSSAIDRTGDSAGLVRAGSSSGLVRAGSEHEG